MGLGSNAIWGVACILMIWACFFAGNAESASHHDAPAPAVDCTNLVLTMADCLSYVTGDASVKKPEGSCCSGLKTVLKTNAECLCEAFRNSAQYGVTLNITKALALPSACHVSAPSVSNCGLNVGSVAPASSPIAFAPSVIAGAPSTGDATNEVAPAPAPGAATAGSSALAISVGLSVLTLFVPTLSLF